MTRPLSELHADVLAKLYATETENAKWPIMADCLDSMAALLRDPRLPDALRLAELAVENHRLRQTFKTLSDPYERTEILGRLRVVNNAEYAIIARLTAREGGANG